MRLLTALCASVLTLGILAPAPAMRVIRDIPYAADATNAHRLDFYLPLDPSKAPLVVFIHGGAFMYGDRRDYAFVGNALASQGIATAVISYRLFPETDAEGATEDAAAATAWAIAHAADYGIDSRNTFVAGHSAGAQIAALIATNPQYLARNGLSLAAIRGVFAISGAYDVRDLSDEPETWQKVDGHIYGDTPQARSRLSPSVHIDPATPPIVISCGSEEPPEMCEFATYFAQSLRAAGHPTPLIREIGPDHMGMLRAFVTPDDPLNEHFLALIARESHSVTVKGTP